MKYTSAFATLAIVLMATPNVWSQQPGSDYYGPHMMWQSGWMIFGPLMMIAIIAIIVVIVVLLMRRLTDHKPGIPLSADESAIVILKERFARGEIDKEEYEERRGVLRD